MRTDDLVQPIRVRPESGRPYSITYRPLSDIAGGLEDAGLRKGRCLVITDETVASLYRDPLESALEGAGWTVKGIILPPGEQTKSHKHLHAVYDIALTWGIDRKTPVLALGGGVIGDLSGYAAATLLRGLPLVQIPTTLIAQVDSAIGGKTGINHSMGKNLIGAFYQPALVWTDLETLRTLPDREWTSGLAELVKTALIADADFSAFVEDHWDAILGRDPDVVGRSVYRAAAIKADVVSRDEREAGLRAILNFGHTFGHAIERTAGYGRFTHGEAVAIGMRAALFLSHRRFPDLPLDRLDRLVRQIPVEGSIASLDVNDLMTAMQADKKVESGALRMVLLESIGRATVADRFTVDEIRSAWAYAAGSGR